MTLNRPHVSCKSVTYFNKQTVCSSIDAKHFLADGFIAVWAIRRLCAVQTADKTDFVLLRLKNSNSFLAMRKNIKHYSSLLKCWRSSSPTTYIYIYDPDTTARCKSGHGISDNEITVLKLALRGLKLASVVMTLCSTRFNIQELHALPTECLSICYAQLSNGNYFPSQHYKSNGVSVYFPTNALSNTTHLAHMKTSVDTCFGNKVSCTESYCKRGAQANLLIYALFIFISLI